MGLTWTGDPRPDGGNGNGNGEHPIVALLAVLAIVLAVLLISWARVEVHGTSDVESALTEPGHAPKPAAKTREEHAVDEAVTSSRFATGLSP
jgi:hypothetical protein